MKLDANNLIIIAALGFGAYWLTKRQATAAPAPAGQNSTLRPNQPMRPGYGAPQGQTNTIGQVAGLLNAGVNAISTLFGGAITRPPGYTPGYFPDTTGEAPAQQYYNDNRDLFAVNPPTTYMPNDGTTGGTGGWLDSQ